MLCAASTIILMCSLHASLPARTAPDNSCSPKMIEAPQEFNENLSLRLMFECANGPFWYRKGDQGWEEIPQTVRITDHNSIFAVSIPYKPADHFLLVASGDCKLFPSDPSKCSPITLLIRTAEVQVGPLPPGQESRLAPHWKPLLKWEGNESQVSADFKGLFQNKPLLLVINGYPVRVEPDSDAPSARQKYSPGTILDPRNDLNVRIYSVPDGCRKFIPDDQTPKQPIAEINIPASLERTQSEDNGIVLGGPKLFDSFLLKQKLATTASQLASISPFSQVQLAAQVGALQGISRDTSYIAAQITTSPTPGISEIANSAANQAVTTTAPSGTSTQTISNACPAGFIPTAVAGSSPTSFTCVAGTGTSALPTQTTTTVNPLTNQVVTTATQPTQQVTTTIPSLSGTVPTAPTLNPLSPPTNVGQSASDTLDEQTRLNAQLITLQMLLQGASSDQLLLTHGRAIGLRSQATIGFPISVSTPREYAGAVAEVRVLILPRRGQAVISQPVSIVNLLPSEKVYNVAKVTSNAKQFGAGVALQLVSFGFTTGKSKDRLYLAKDTDTVALEYPVVPPSSSASDMCGNLPTGDEFNPDADDFSSAVMFGWQYRPVLGAAIVAPGVRTGFAQLALPQSDAFAFDPEVWVQTRWLKYDQKKQITGSVYDESCHWRRLPDPVSIANPVVVKDVRVSDEGQGMLRFHATGDFFSFSGQVRSGSLSAPPQYFDGYSLEFFKLASDVLANGNLEILDEAMHVYSLVTPVKPTKDCRITNPRLSALPKADGTSLMELSYDRPDYKPDPGNDGPQHPLLLIGTSVYGLRDKPLQPLRSNLLDSACWSPVGDSAAHCKFKFVAKTEDVVSAENFLVRDPAWDSQGVTGSIKIDPTFTKIDAIAKPAAKDNSGDASDDSIPGCPKDPPDCKKLKSDQIAAKDAQKKKDEKQTAEGTWFRLSGTNLSKLDLAQILTDNAPATYCGNDFGCLQILEDGSDGAPKHVDRGNIRVASDDTIWLKLHKPVQLHIFWAREHWPASEWDLAPPKDDKTSITANPAVLYETDSRAVTFTGADFSKVTAVTFEGNPLAMPVPVSKANLVVQVTSSVTAKFGHKELLALIGVDDKGKPKYLVLSIDVVKH